MNSRHGHKPAGMRVESMAYPREKNISLINRTLRWLRVKFHHQSSNVFHIAGECVDCFLSGRDEVVETARRWLGLVRGVSPGCPCHQDRIGTSDVGFGMPRCRGKQTLTRVGDIQSNRELKAHLQKLFLP